MFENVSVGDVIAFGMYPQDWNGKENSCIDWQVLSVDDDTIKMITLKGLDSFIQGPDCKDIDWQNSLLRAYLNKDFVTKAFSDDELQVIIGDVDSLDEEEVLRYLPSLDERKCDITEYAKKNKAYCHTMNATGTPGNNKGWWWIKPLEYGSKYKYVNHLGDIANYIGGYICSIRPVITIKK